MTYVKVNDTLYPATVKGNTYDRDWDNRHSKAITLEMSHNEAAELFQDDVKWSIVVKTEITREGEEGIPITEEVSEEYDNSSFRMAGDITDHRDGTVTVKMGELTDLELALMAALI